MRIGVLTFHRSFNYGAFMQCYSLTQRLQKEFPEHQVEIIDYTVKRVKDYYDAELYKYGDPDAREKVQERNNAFLKVQNTLPLSEYSCVSDDYNDTVDYMNKTYDAVVVGSDAVWNWIVRGFPNLYFLKDYKGKKYSYAASVHGMNYQDITVEQKVYLKEAFSQFEYIGVRDTTTENMVKYINPELTVCHNCDPTAFLNINDVPCNIDELKKKLIQKGVDFSKPIIGLMATNTIGKEIKEFWKDKVQIVALYAPNKYADIYLNDLTPYEWAKVFSFFKVTVTHFFHGTMLSLVNGVPVIPIEFENEFSRKNKTKICDIMERLGLLSWRFSTDNGGQNILLKVLHKLNLLNNKALWKSVNKLIEELMQKEQSDLIKQKLKEEAKSYDTFYNAISKLK